VGNRRKHIVFDVSVIINLWLGARQASVTETLMDTAWQQEMGMWISASSIATLDYVAKRRFKQAGLDPEEADRLIPRLMEDLFQKVQVLSNHGFDQQECYGHAQDFEDAQISVATRALSGMAVCVVTEDEAFDAVAGVSAKSPSDALDWLLSDTDLPIAFIDLAGQQAALRPKIEEGIERVLRHGQYIMGPEIREIEEKLAAFVGVEHCISCASGTDALLMALMALDIGPGDEVITVPYTWISTAEVISLLRAKPVFVDIRPDTFNMDPDLLEAALTQRTKAIIPVGIYGQCADMTRINQIADKHGIPVIEDAAQCFGATHYGKQACSLSLIGCTSFFPSKPLGCYGDGGAIFTPDDALADKMCQIRIHGQKIKHQHPLVGINGRLDTLQAAILLEKFTLFPEECDLRSLAGKRYDTLLDGIPGIQPPVIAIGNTSVYAQYTILSPDRDRLSQSLKQSGIPSVAYYTAPLHLQGAFADLDHKAGDFPVAEKVATQCLSLPMSPYLRQEEQERVVRVICS
jgi:UDP-2-acetamido-2-deoxy-ribo-hexuluronate aminotransferase